MGKIVYIMGKSSTGKDTIFRKLVEEGTWSLKVIVPYTTRPIRAGERNGLEYFFTNEEGYQKLSAQGKIVEQREYHTYHGVWRYFTVDDGQIDLTANDYIMIGTLESYQRVKKYFGEDKLIPVLIELDDGSRLRRALNRECTQEQPKYEEMCRRFLADGKDFQEEKIKEAGINRRFQNDDLDHCLCNIRNYIIERIR